MAAFRVASSCYKNKVKKKKLNCFLNNRILAVETMFLYLDETEADVFLKVFSVLRTVEGRNWDCC